MTTIDLAALGISQDEIQERVINRMADQLLRGISFDEDGDEITTDSNLKRKLDAAIQERIDRAVTALADAHVLPLITNKIESLVLQQTNKWGEAQGEAVTFIEYLIRRADAYMVEPVNFDGKVRGDFDQYRQSDFRAHSSRVALMIDKHLYHAIETAMKQALATANSSIKDGLEKAVKISLEKIVTGLSVAVKTESR